MAVCYHFAIGRLFRSFYGTADRGVNLLGGICLHPRHDMAVKVKGNLDRGMPEVFAGNLRMDAGRQHLRRMRMPKVMGADAGQGGLGQDAHPFMRERSRLDRGTVILRHHDAVSIRTNAKAKLFLCLPGAMCLQFGYNSRGERHRAGMNMRVGRRASRNSAVCVAS